jgi:hypothetical protein
MGMGNPSPEPIPIRAIPMVPEVHQEVPVARAAIEQMIRVAGRKIEGCRILRP